ncbi:MAG TPA: universal stress protein [Planctomycetota bacterium]|nr:universal stress protein [Planctomycetota bacterium]
MIRRVLVGLDGSAAAERALPWVRAVAPGAELVLARVLVPVAAPSAEGALSMPLFLDDPAEEYLARLAGSLRPRPSTVVRVGSPAGTLLEIARDERCDLVAVTTRGGGRLRRRLLGGTTENLLHHGDLPLLVVPAWARPPRRGIRRIAVPLDGSAAAERALPLARFVARKAEASILLVHCAQEIEEMERLHADLWGAVRRTPEILALERALERLRRDLVRRFGRLAQRLERAGVRGAEALFVRGPFPEEFLRAVRRRGADLVALCVRGHGALRHALLGSKTSRLVQSAPVPVLVTRGDRS